MPERAEASSVVQPIVSRPDQCQEVFSNCDLPTRRADAVDEGEASGSGCSVSPKTLNPKPLSLQHPKPCVNPKPLFRVSFVFDFGFRAYRH